MQVIAQQFAPPGELTSATASGEFGTRYFGEQIGRIQESTRSRKACRHEAVGPIFPLPTWTHCSAT